VLDVPGGVMWPDVASDGSTVVFTSLTADGYDVFAASIPRAAARSAGPAPVAATTVEPGTASMPIPEREEREERPALTAPPTLLGGRCCRGPGRRGSP